MPPPTLPILSTLSGPRYNLQSPDLANVALLDTQCLPLISRMMEVGLLLDTSATNTITTDCHTIESVQIEKIKTLTGVTINPESGDQVAGLVYGEMGLHHCLPKPPAATKSGKRFTTDDDAISTMIVQCTGLGEDGAVEVLRAIAAARQANTIRTMFSEPLVRYAERAEDGRVRPRLKYTTAKTGRLACEKPNLQNIPVRSELGKRIRKAFLAGKRRRLISCDYAQIEMRMAGHESGDEVLCGLIVDGADIHTMTAAAIFRIDPKSVTKLQRMVCKTLGFAILYGVTPEGLQEQIFSAGGPYWSVEECAKLIDAWFATYARVWEWVCEQQARAVRWGCVWDMWGRPKLVPEGFSRVERIRDRGFRECGNQPLQAGAQGILKAAMCEIQPIISHYLQYGFCEPVMQIHDELLFEADEDFANDFARDIQSAMASVVQLSVPVEASSDVGERWGDLK